MPDPRSAKVRWDYKTFICKELDCVKHWVFHFIQQVAIHKPPASETRGKKPPGTLKATSCSSDHRIHFSGFGCGLRESHPITAHNTGYANRKALRKVYLMRMIVIILPREKFIYSFTHLLSWWILGTYHMLGPMLDAGNKIVKKIQRLCFYGPVV